MSKHKHHIIPKYMGGTNDPSNLIELTVEEHAEAHRLLYEQHGNWQDLVAWKSLSGQLNSDEARRLKCKYLRTGAKMSDETKQKLREVRKLQKSSGWVWSEESKKKQSQSHTGKILDKKHKENIGNSLRGKPTKENVCPHCSKVGKSNAMKRWHFDNCKDKK